MLTNAELQELAHFKAKLRRKMSINVELSMLATDKTYCRDMLAQAESYAAQNSDAELIDAVQTIRLFMGFLDKT